jgi:excisionase family DNA binding protein
MTPLGPGHLLIAPADVGLLADLLREGARTVTGRRRLTPREAELLMAAEGAAYSARSGLGPAAVVGAVQPASSWLTPGQAAKELQVTDRHVRRLARSGALAAERHGPVWLVSADSVASYRLQQEQEKTS